METENKFLVIDFTDGPQVIPRLWMTPSKKHVRWPEVRNMQTFYKIAKLEKKPDSSWKKELIVKEICDASKFHNII